MNRRRAEILLAWNAGRTYAQIARDHGISKARVRQVVKQARNHGEHVRKGEADRG